MYTTKEQYLAYQRGYRTGKREQIAHYEQSWEAVKRLGKIWLAHAKILGHTAGCKCHACNFARSIVDYKDTLHTFAEIISGTQD